MTQPNEPKDSLNRITRSPSYRLAYEDVDFMNSPRLRAARMELEFLKPEFAFEDHGIENTIVVFGSTRIVESAVARHRLEDARQRLAQQPGNAACQRAVAQAERLMTLERDVKKAQLALLIRIKNLLTSAQQAKLSELQKAEGK